MEQEEQNLAIFRGRIKFKYNAHKIWGVFLLLSIITNPLKTYEVQKHFSSYCIDVHFFLKL